MNYRHGHHAGNIADVFKHYVLSLTLAAFHNKETPVCVVDTHAGAGLYPMKPRGEHEQGISRLWPQRAAWPGLSGYLDVVAAYNPGPLTRYPGSPLIIQKFLRPGDRAVCFEMQPQEYARLVAHVGAVGGMTLHEANGWSAMRALLPPKENRGLVFIDPPFERPDEFDVQIEALATAVRQWRNGVYLAWYPVKQRRPIDRLHNAVRALKREAVAIEFLTLPVDVEQRLNGSGIVAINPPWKLVDTLSTSLPPLAEFLAGPAGRPDVQVIPLSE